MKLRSKTGEETDPSTDRWLVSYADFITLLFAFFVILYATSERDLEKTKAFQNSVEKFLIKAGAFGESGAKVSQGEKNFSVIEPPIQTFRPSKPEDQSTLNSLETKLESQFTVAERKKYLIDLAPEERGVRLIIATKEIYSQNSSKFSPSALPFVNHLAQILVAEKKKLFIEGHVGSNQNSPWELASARSINLLRYLEKRYNWDQKNLAAATFGASKPLSDGKQANQNERLELLLLSNDAEF